MKSIQSFGLIYWILTSVWNPYILVTSTILHTSYENGENVTEYSTRNDETSTNLKSPNVFSSYQVVDYITNQTEQSEAKVRDLHIPYPMYYTHIYHSWKEADRTMSVVSFGSADSREGFINGVNMVLELSKLDSMYAPGRIAQVLNFVRPCYNWAAGPMEPTTEVYISTMRTAQSTKINQALIEYTTQQFFWFSPKGSLLMLWEKHSIMNYFLESLNYTLVKCGGNGHLCDWTRLGLQPEEARDQCLYKIRS